MRKSAFGGLPVLSHLFLQFSNLILHLFFPEIHLTETQKYDRDKSVRGMSPARLSSKTKTVYQRYEYYYHCDCGRVAADTTKALLCRVCGALCDKLSMSRLRPFIPCVSCAYA